MKDFIIRRLMLITVIALSVIYSAMALWRMSEFGPGFMGSESYSRIASHVITHKSFESPFRPPLYPLFLAGLMSVFPSTWEVAAVWTQGLFGVLLGILLVAATVRVTGSAASGYLTLALYLSNILFQFEIMAKRETTLFTFASVVFLTAFLFLSQLRTKYLVMALSLIVAFLLRPTAIALIPVFVVACYFDRTRPDFSFKLLFLPALIFLLPLLPWQLFIYEQTGSLPITTSSNSGQTLWKGNNPNLFSAWPRVDIDVLEPEMSKGIGGADITLPRSDVELKSQAVQYIKDHPGVFIRNAAAKALLFFSPWPIPYGSGEYVVENGTPAIKHFRYRNSLILFAATVHCVLIWVGWFGFLMRATPSSSERLIASLGIALMLFLLGIHTITYPEARYRMALDVFLTIPAAVFFSSWLRTGLGARKASSEPVIC